MPYKEIKDFSGTIWHIDSEQPFSVKQCPNCGKPLRVTLAFLEASLVETVIFRNSEGKILGMFDTKGFPADGEPITCHFCGYVDKHS